MSNKILSLAELPEAIREKAIRAIKAVEASPKPPLGFEMRRSGNDRDVWCLLLGRDHRLLFSNPSGAKFIFSCALTSNTYENICHNGRRARTFFETVKRRAGVVELAAAAFGAPAAMPAAAPDPVEPSWEELERLTAPPVVQSLPVLAPPTAAGLLVADVAIRRDDAGRYCLNDLHRAAGGEKRHQPSDWMRSKQTKDLLEEMGGPGIPGGPLVTVNDGRNNGTYVAKELVYAYAMWISPAFHLKVIRAYDGLVTAPAPQFAIPQTLSEALRLAADLSDRNAQLEQTTAVQAAKIEVDAPKVIVYDQLCSTKDSWCMRESAKSLGQAPLKFNEWMVSKGWVYRVGGKKGLLQAQASKITAGYLVHKPFIGGTEQVRITAAGLARLAIMLSVEPPPQALAA